MSFRPLPDHELQQLADDDLIVYVRGARDAGAADAARRALALLVFGYEPHIKARLRMKVPPHVVDDLAHEVLVRAVSSAFAGESVGEFRSWLHVITGRTIADFFERSKRRPMEAMLPSEHLGEDDMWGMEPTVSGEAEAVELRVAVDEVLETLSDSHRQAVELHLFADLTAQEVAGRIPGMSAANVAQIASRFRSQLRARLDSGTGARS